jgi:site-specific recombinase XerD
MRREVLPRWGDRPLEDIRRRDVISRVESIADRGAPFRANRVLAYARRLLVWCTRRDLIPANPAAGVDKPTPEQHRDRVLSDQELARRVARRPSRWAGPSAPSSSS